MGADNIYLFSGVHGVRVETKHAKTTFFTGGVGSMVISWMDRVWVQLHIYRCIHHGL